MIPIAFVHDLLARVDIVDVVGRHVQLKKGGANLMGLCPFHGEKSPSFSVSPTKQFYHCFGCGASGDAIRFLTEHTGASFVEAVNDLAQQVGMTVPEEESTPAERERAAALKQRRSTLTDVLAKSAEHFRRQLKGSPRAIDYLKRRGLSGEIASHFGLGYAPEGWRGLASVFPAYDDPLLEESGMVIAQDADAGDEATRKRYDRFRDRIMFPIHSVQGDVIGFGGRVLDQGEPKYLNSPETPLFSKGRELYGLHEARAGLRQRGHALVVEGYMDVVALAQAGFANAVATLGTACTADHVQKLFRFTDSVVFSFDGDAAGRRAARRALEASLPHASDTRTVRFLFLPPEHDPDSYVRQHGAAAFERCVTEAVPLSRQIAEAASEGCDLESAEGRAHMLANARALWVALPEGALKLQVLGELASRGRLETGELLPLWDTAPSTRQAAGSAPRTKPRRRTGRVSLGTANLLDRTLWLLLHRSELWATLDNESHDMLAGQPAPYDAFFACVERTVLEHGPLAPAALMQELRVPAAGDGSTVLARIAQFHDPEAQTDIAVELAKALDGLRLQAVEEELKLMFESGELSPDSQARCKQLMDTRSRLKAGFAQLQRGSA